MIIVDELEGFPRCKHTPRVKSAKAGPEHRAHQCAIRRLKLLENAFDITSIETDGMMMSTSLS